MQLNTLMKLIRNAFHIDNELRAYIYADRIEFIEHDTEIDLGNGEILNEFNGRLCVMYLDNTNKITTIEHSSLSMITPRNIGIYRGLIDLIDVEIADLNNYPKGVGSHYTAYRKKEEGEV